jgi:predicted methyltransferase
MRLLGAGCVAAMLVARAAYAATIPAHISAAVADPSRPVADRERDAGRAPAEVLAFAGIEPGDKVLDFMPGNGYFTRIFCKAVGESGHVYAVSVPSPSTPEPPSHACTNVTASLLKASKRAAPELWSSNDDPGMVYEYWSFSSAAENFTAPEPLDLIWISENYHDLHNEQFGAPNMAVVNKALFSALKPGGVLVIEDHAAVRGSGVRDTRTLHRIEAREVKREVIAAGFVFVAESKLLRNPRDPHTAKAHELHDRTDRFLFKFRKP